MTVLRCCILLLWLPAMLAAAASCSSVFPDPAGSYSSSGYIQFQPQTSLVGSDGQISFASMVDNSGGSSCDTVACQLSGSSAAGMAISAYQYSPSTTDRYIQDNTSATLNAGDYRNITLGNGSSLTAVSSNNTFKIKSLSVNFNAVLTLQSGIYWIETLNLGQNAQLQVASGAKVVIYTRDFSTNISNQINTNGNPDQLLMYSEGNITFGQYSQVKGYFYAVASASYNTDVQHTGAVNALNVIMQDRAKITYDQSGVSTFAADNLCTQAAFLPTATARWTMNACALTGASGEVVDAIAGINGQSFEDPSIDSNGKLCQAAYFRGDGDHIRLPHSNRYEVSAGTVSFWMKVDNLSFVNFENAQAGGMALLSKDSRNNYSGQFTIWVTSTGAIKVSQESRNSTYQINSTPVITEGQWHHVVYSVGAAGMQVYVDKVLVGSNSSYTSGWQNNNRTTVIAANANRHDVNNSAYSDIGDFYQGRMDDVRLYNSQLSEEQVALLFAESEASCTSCSSNATLLSHWNMDVCSLNGSSGEIVDVVSGINGQAVDGARAENYGRFCQAVGFDGNNDHINIPHHRSYELTSGSISLWFKVANLDHNLDRNGESFQALFSKDSRGRDYGGQLTIYLDQDGRFLFKHETRSRTYEVYSAPEVEERERWYHLVYTWSSSGFNAYLDGVYLGSYSVRGLTLRYNREPIILGASAANSSNNASYSNELTYHMLGDIDDVRIYDGELSTADVQGLYTASDYTCTSCTGAVAKLHYQFEEASWDGAGAVIDSSAEGNNGTPVGRVTPELPANDISCRALDVPYNNRYNQLDEVDSNLDLNTIGPRGTVSFWYRSDSAWIGGGQRMLFDASRGGANNASVDKYFFMSLTNNGELAFGMEDRNDGDMQVKSQSLGYSANEWVHIALSWDVASEDVNLYVNGSRVYMYGNWAFSSSELGNLSSVKIGDSSANYFVYEMTANSANGQIDDFRLYDYEQSREAIRADLNSTVDCVSVHHYEITHPEQTLTCSAATITIKACANASCSELVTDPVSVNLPNGDWSVSMPVTFSGSVTTTLEQSAAGSFPLSVTAADTDSAPQSPADCTTDCNIDFVNAGFEFYDTVAPYSSVLPDVIAEADLGRIGLRAVRDNAGVCQALLTGSQSVSLSYDCIDGGTGYSPDQCSVPLAGVPVNGSGAGQNTASVTLNFNADGETSLSGFSYADAGRVALAATASVNGVTIDSGSAQFDSIPASISLGATAASSQTAGVEFTLSMSARGANNTVLPGYQPGTMQMSLLRIAPVSVNAAEAQLFVAASQSVTSAASQAWSDVSVAAFSDGSWRFDQAYVSEVGSYTWDVQDADYLGNVISANDVGPGRIIPAYFDVRATTTPQFEDQCSSQFTYIGQPFDFVTGSEPELSVTAYNAKGQVTRNYSDSLWQLNQGSSGLSAISFADNSAYNGALNILNAGDTPVITDNTDFDGEGKITVLNTQVSYSKIATPLPGAGNGSPFSADASMTFAAPFLTDADGVCYQTAYPGSCEAFSFGSIQGTDLRYGRLRIENTFGPETETLTAPLVTEYYDNGNWMINVQDSCTALSLSQSSGQVSVANVSEGNDEQDITSYLPGISSTGVLSAGKSPDTMINLGPAMQNGIALRGAVKLTLEPAASGADWAGYLNIDWDGDGDIDTNDKPSGEAFFGIYRGNDRTIHIREGY
ncbi:MAG: LamG domain-containing protein [Pseudomonadota bacterium]|nr:LamG domain-containing protein [Pseudomonadota bacterium]